MPSGPRSLPGPPLKASGPAARHRPTGFQEIAEIHYPVESGVGGGAGEDAGEGLPLTREATAAPLARLFA